MSTISGLLPTVVNSAVGTLVGLGVGWTAKRLYRRDKERVEALVDTVEQLFGIAINLPDHQTKAATMNLRQYRKAIAAGFGVLLTGLLTWASTDGVLAQLIAPIVPAAERPLIGVLTGGLATVASVVLAKNEQIEAAMQDTKTPVVVTPTTAAPTTVAQIPTQLAHLAYEAAQTTERTFTAPQTSPTSIVQLQPIPAASAL
jgi:hypothetical protein